MKSIALVLSLALLFSCATAKLVTIDDPQMVQNRTKAQYKTILIAAAGVDYLGQKKYEDRVEKIITKTCDLSTYKSYELFPPTREYSENDMSKIIKDKKIEAILVSKAGAHNQTTNVGAIPVFLSSGTTFMPFSTTSVAHNENVFLRDAKTNKIVWYSIVHARGGSQPTTMNNMIIDKFVTELLKVGLVGDGTCYDRLMELKRRAASSRR